MMFRFCVIKVRAKYKRQTRSSHDAKGEPRVAFRPILACLREVCPPFISGRNRSLTARKDEFRGPAHNADTLNFSKLEETQRLLTPVLSLEVPQFHLGHAVLDNKKSFFFYT